MRCFHNVWRRNSFTLALTFCHVAWHRAPSRFYTVWANSSPPENSFNKIMSAAEIHTYQYLWDGSQPGWVLTRLSGNYVDLSLKFELSGPSTRELMAVRRSVREFKSVPLNQLIEQLRRCRPTL